MVTLRHIIPVLCATATLTGAAVFAVGADVAAGADAAAAATPAGTPPGGPGGPGGPGWHHGHHSDLGEMGFVLHKLDLTPEQKTQVKSIFESQKSQFEALRTSSEANRDALASTPPTDAAYPALIQTAQSNSSQRITLMSQTWRQVYESVLTKVQQEKIPGIVAAAKAQRAAFGQGRRPPPPPADE